MNSRNGFVSADLVVAYKMAVEYYLRREPDGSLKKLKDVAEDLGLPAARFGELIKLAWQAGIVSVTIEPPAGVGVDYRARRKMEIELYRKLKRHSPPLLDRHGGFVREHKLLNVHVVPDNAFPNVSPDKLEYEDPSFFESTMARICKRAGTEFLSLIREHYNDKPADGSAQLFCGIGWSRTCERIVNLMPVPMDHFPDLVVCPLIGLIGHKDNQSDSNYLAFRLGTRLSGWSIKIAAPSVRPPDLELEKMRPIARALSDISKCEIGINGIAPAYYENFDSALVRRKVITQNQLRNAVELGAVAELSCHFIDIHGNLIPYDKTGFKPVGISYEQMQTIPRFIVVVSPQPEKLLPAIVSIKAGICSDLVIGHRMALAVLDGAQDREFRID